MELLSEERVNQHEQNLWKALQLPGSEEVEPSSNKRSPFLQEIEKIFKRLAADLESSTASVPPSAKILQNHRLILDAYVPKQKQSECLAFLDKYNQFSYPGGSDKKTVRSASQWKLYANDLYNIFTSYYNLSFYADSMSDYYKNKKEFQKDPLYYKIGPNIYDDNLIAAELDAKTTDLPQILEDMLLSENNTVTLLTFVIRGILKSSHSHLHKILGDFLLSFKQQEEIRQIIFENMDCGTAEAFLALFCVIAENNFICFSNVKRTISTWIGLYDSKHAELITSKQLDLIKQSLLDREFCRTLTKSSDSIELYIGLWTLGFFEIQDALSCCKELIANGTKNQKLVISYYSRFLQDRKFVMQISSQILETYPQDIELCAAFLPIYMQYNMYYLLSNAIYGKEYPHQGRVYEPIPFDLFYLEPAQAKKHFFILKELSHLLPKKRQTYPPCIFPWYSVTITLDQIATRMATLAYMLQEDELIDQVCPLIPAITTEYRDYYLDLLLHHPKTALQKQTLLQSLADKHSRTRRTAFDLISKLDLEEKDFEQIIALLKHKNPEIREKILDLLEKQKESILILSIQTLLTDKKEEMHLGGLDLLIRLKKDSTRKKEYQTCLALLSCLTNPTEKEAIVLNELTGVSQTDHLFNQKGYGLFNPDAAFLLPACESDPSFFSDLFHKTYLGLFQTKREEIDFLFQQLEDFYVQNKDRTYTNANGYEYLLGNSYSAIEVDDKKDPLDRYPFPELWRTFYQEQIQTFPMLLNLYMFTILNDNYPYRWTKIEAFLPLVKKIYGEEYVEYFESNPPYPHWYCFHNVIQNLFLSYAKQEENHKLLVKTVYSMLALFTSLPIEETTYRPSVTYGEPTTYYALNSFWLDPLLSYPEDWKTNEEFVQMFLHFERINQFYGNTIFVLNFLDYIKAYEQNLISLDNVYQIAWKGLGIAFSQLCPVICSTETNHTKNSRYNSKTEPKVIQIAQEFYWKTLEVILKVELKRSESNTPFSYMIKRICKVRGIRYLIEILTALGNDTLNRSVYYRYSIPSDKNACLSYLLSVSEPLPEENGNTLKRFLKGKNISDRRLVEVAMYNPKWIDCIEEYLGWAGLKSGIYYFIAHTNENFSAQTAAVIAKYTPLSTEELHQGAFDLYWFFECSKQLGKARFQVLCNSAKYICNTNKHTRARKYADAALGKVTVEELETIIQKKRNKDTLMSYALIPIENEKDALHRYQFLHKFLKESQQFSAKRKASEKIAVSMGLKNLAVNTGYSDVTRLTLNMESKLTEQKKSCFQWQNLEDLKLKIQIDENGTLDFICEKNGKRLKSIPAKYKNHSLVLELKETCRQLQEQYSRTKAMMEQFMEYGIEMTVSEIANLQKNPIIQPILKNLVYLCGKQTGFFHQSILTDCSGVQQSLTPKEKLRIAHPFDLWKLGVWLKYQNILFHREIKQPFKQVFRELYVKTEEESEQIHSLRYAGNQICPIKTAACLKKRNWTADYKDGLQKVYYKENIIAQIYAEADWFSPSDIEAPVLEWVEFSDRKTFQKILIKDVPDRIFSEVMRDVDLAVSIAHTGGTEPKTSPSAIEMRKTILKFNLPLFGLSNVTFSENHALIAGTLGNYTIHLGSGAVFKEDGTPITVLPAHLQNHGKLFLPFTEEEPKMAEIMSKIVLFAEDGKMKMKDPYILNQL